MSTEDRYYPGGDAGTIVILQNKYDEVYKELKQLKELVYNFFDFTPHCDENVKCFTCGEQWVPNECEDTCEKKLLSKAIKEGSSASIVWLELCDKLEAAKTQNEELKKEVEHYKSYYPTWLPAEIE